VAAAGGQEARTWILFISGIVLLFLFAWRGADLGPWWTTLLGAMLGLSVMVSALQHKDPE
jgi:hypothetical protein